MRPLTFTDEHFDCPPGRYLRATEVCGLLGFGRTTLYKCMKQRDRPFPKPIKIGALSRWSERDIAAWIILMREPPCEAIHVVSERCGRTAHRVL